MKASIIIRTKNEERWISSCLESVFKQKYDDFEVILVDNMSDDATVEKAKEFPVKLITIDEFRPGLAINEGFKASTGDALICLSGHCIPVHDFWLDKLVEPLVNPEVAGVYGRQQPMSFTTDRDKRDLLTVFGLDAKVQKKDPFFHNANSAIRRDVWERFPYDEETPHIEDRIWAHEVLALGKYEIRYEPDASVFHYHGIHQNDNPKRRRNVVQIMEALTDGEGILPAHHIAHPIAPSPEEVDTIALIPTRGELKYVGGVPLLSYTLEQAKSSQFIDKIVVLTDNENTATYAKEQGAEAPFLRPKELSRDFVAISEVLKFGLEELGRLNISADVCLVLEEIYPFRTDKMIDELITLLLREGSDCVVAAKKEPRSIWLERENNFEAISPLQPRNLKKEEFLVGLFGLGFVTYPKHIRNLSLGMSNPYVYIVEEAFSALEIRNEVQCEQAKSLLLKWMGTSKEPLKKTN